jgi:hypothetical protein
VTLQRFGDAVVAKARAASVAATAAAAKHRQAWIQERRWVVGNVSPQPPWALGQLEVPSAAGHDLEDLVCHPMPSPSPSPRAKRPPAQPPSSAKTPRSPPSGRRTRSSTSGTGHKGGGAVVASDLPSAYALVEAKLKELVPSYPFVSTTLTKAKAKGIDPCLRAEARDEVYGVCELDGIELIESEATARAAVIDDEVTVMDWGAGMGGLIATIACSSSNQLQVGGIELNEPVFRLQEQLFAALGRPCPSILGNMFRDAPVLENADVFCCNELLEKHEAKIIDAFFTMRVGTGLWTLRPLRLHATRSTNSPGDCIIRRGFKMTFTKLVRRATHVSWVDKVYPMYRYVLSLAGDEVPIAGIVRGTVRGEALLSGSDDESSSDSDDLGFETAPPSKKPKGAPRKGRRPTKAIKKAGTGKATKQRQATASRAKRRKPMKNFSPSIDTSSTCWSETSRMASLASLGRRRSRALTPFAPTCAW